MDEVVRHYRAASLYERILAAADQAGIDAADLTIDDLGPVDEFHVGGRLATEHLMAGAGIPAGSRVLDVGSGIGGTARYLAHHGSHSVTGVDLTPDYVEVAGALTELVGLDGTVKFEHADVLGLSFETASFDAAVMLHVGMNIEDKRSAFSEVARVLVDGGVFAIYDIMATQAAEPTFPVPWAASPEGSFLDTPDAYVEALGANGFEVVHMADRSEFAGRFFTRLRRNSGPPPPLGLHLLMGEEAGVRYGNMVDAVSSGAVAPVEIIAAARAR